MGCDIHLFIEKRNENFDWEIFSPSKYMWEISSYSKGTLVVWRDNNDLLEITRNGHNEEIYCHLLDWNVGRDYNLFCRLAGVRSYREITPIEDPKGTPCDISEEIAITVERWDCDGHSHSYYFLNELLEYFNEEGEFGYFYDDIISKMLEISEDENKEDVRIVFFFDN